MSRRIKLSDLSPKLRATITGAPALTNVQKSLKKEKARLAREKLTRKFSDMWKRLGGPELKTEHIFHDVRKWRMDYVHLPTKVCIEIDGGVFSGGSHVRGVGFEDNADKRNEAQFMGYRMFNLSTRTITEDRVAKIIQFINQLSKPC